MKNILLLFLFLVPAFLFAQYPATGNKSRLGYQTTGDGLIWRGVAADTVTKPRTTANAYFQLDTVNGVLRRYIATLGKWQTVGGGGASIDSLVYSTIKGLNDSIQAEKQTLFFDSGTGDLSISDGNNVSLLGILNGYTSGTGTANRVPVWNTSTSFTNSNIQDNGTAVSILNNKPFQLGQWTTAGRPSGVTGYEGYNTTGNGKEWYQGSRWAYALESTFARGTATRVPFFDANGQVTDSDKLTFSQTASVSTLQLFTVGSDRARIRLTSVTNPSADMIFSTAGGGLSSISIDNTQLLHQSNQNIVFNTNAVNGTTSFNFNTVQKVVFKGDNVGIKDATPSYSLDIFATDAIAFPGGTVAQRPVTEASKYLLRYNTDSSAIEIGTHTSTWNLLSTRTYARGMTLGNQLQAGNVHITPTGQRTLTFKRTRLSVSTDVYDSTGVGKIIIQPDTTIALNIFSIRNAEIGQSLLQFGGGRSIGFRALNYTGRKQFWDIERVNLINSTILPLYGEQGAAQSFSIGASKIDFIGDLANSTLSRIRFQTGNTSSGYSQPLTLYENGTAVVSWGNPAYYGRIIGGGVPNTLPANFPNKSLVVGDTCTNCDDLSKVTFVHDPNDSTFIKGNIRFFTYGTPATTAAALSKTLSNYGVGFATDGTVTSREIKRDTTIYVTDADYNFAAAITSAQILARHNRIIIYSKLSSGATSDNQIILHSASADFLQCEIIIYSNDASADADATSIDFTTNGAVDGAGGTTSTYGLSPGQRVNIRAVNDGGYKWFFN